MYTVFQFKLILSFSVKVYTYVVSTITVGTLFQQHGHDVEEPLSCSDVKSCVSVIVCRRRLNTFLDQDAYTLPDATLHCLKKSLRLGRIRGKCPHNTTLQTARNYATKMPHKRRCKWVLIWHTVCASMWQLMVKHRIYGTGHATPSSVQYDINVYHLTELWNTFLIQHDVSREDYSYSRLLQAHFRIKTSVGLKKWPYKPK